MTLSEKYATLRWRLAQYLEGRWWRRYLRAKSPDTYLAEKNEYWARTLRQLDWQPVAGRKVLDAGCGPAGLFIHLHDTESVTALDPLLANYEANLEIFSRRRYPDVTFHHQPLEQTLAGNPSFEAIYCFNAINHVEDWEVAMDRLAGYAGPGARMILTSDVHRHALLLPIFKLLPGDALHPQQHAAAAYRNALTGRGWKIDREVELRREFIFSYRAWVCTYAGS